MKKLQFFKIFNKISLFFQKFFENFIEFLAKIWTKISKNAFVGVRGAEPPDASEFMEI